MIGVGDIVLLPDGERAVVQEIGETEAAVIQWERRLGAGPWIYPIASLTQIATAATPVCHVLDGDYHKDETGDHGWRTLCGAHVTTGGARLPLGDLGASSVTCRACISALERV